MKYIICDAGIEQEINGYKQKIVLGIRLEDHVPVRVTGDTMTAVPENEFIVLKKGFDQLHADFNAYKETTQELQDIELERKKNHIELLKYIAGGCAHGFAVKYANQMLNSYGISESET